MFANVKCRTLLSSFIQNTVFQFQFTEFLKTSPIFLNHRTDESLPYSIKLRRRAIIVFSISAFLITFLYQAETLGR